MAVNDEDGDEVELGNGDTLAERLESLNLDEDDTATVDELRDRLGL